MMATIHVEEIVCIRTASGAAGTAGDVDDDERGPLDEDAACADAVMADAMAARDAGVFRAALAQALGLDGARGPWCPTCGLVCRCGRAS